MSNLTEKFIKGLKNYNLTLEDIQTQNFKYCGGNKGSHYNYFKVFFKERLKQTTNWYPELKNECVCGHYIEENCYIINNSGLILTLGNCCIKKFVPKSTRTCEICECPHKNRVVNRCNDCRFGICDKCDKKCNEKYKLCWNCFNNEREEQDYDDDYDDESNTEIEKEKTVFEVEKVIKFGKYKGETYNNIFIKDINYLRWLLTQDWFNDKDYIIKYFNPEL